jgi:hypothetical protein
LFRLTEYRIASGWYFATKIFSYFLTTHKQADSIALFAVYFFATVSKCSALQPQFSPLISPNRRDGPTLPQPGF